MKSENDSAPSPSLNAGSDLDQYASTHFRLMARVVVLHRNRSSEFMNGLGFKAG
jgi:hypothetical protein